MDTKQIEDKFKSIGASAEVRDPRHADSPMRSRWSDRTPRFTVDVARDGKFMINLNRENLDVRVLDSNSGQRHALIQVQDGDEKANFLCGHDERQWFVAAVPENRRATTIRQAMQALKPQDVIEAERRTKVRGKKRYKRKNKARIRQGEWFFVPAPDIKVPALEILRNEPIQRGGGNPHTAEECYRVGGVEVYVNRLFPNGLTQSEYNRVIKEHRNESEYRNWRKMVRNASVYVRGKVRHPEHKTVKLNGWHRVVPNTETESRAMQHVAFLD